MLVAGCGSRVGRDQLGAAGGALSLSSANLPTASGAPTGQDTAGQPASGSTVSGTPAVAATPGAGTAGAPGGAGAVNAASGGSGSVAAAAGPGRPSSKTAAGGAAQGASGTAPAGATPTPGAAAGSARAPPAPGAAGSGGAKTPIVFGTFGTGSGVIGRAVQPIITADKAWSADINARGGLAGHPVRLIFGDDGGDPAAALAIAKRMVEQDKVV